MENTAPCRSYLQSLSAIACQSILISIHCCRALTLESPGPACPSSLPQFHNLILHKHQADEHDRHRHTEPHPDIRRRPGHESIHIHAEQARREAQRDIHECQAGQFSDLLRLHDGLVGLCDHRAVHEQVHPVAVASERFLRLLG